MPKTFFSKIIIVIRKSDLFSLPFELKPKSEEKNGFFYLNHENIRYFIWRFY